MDEDVVWLYKVYDTSGMTADQLQDELNKWSNNVTPHEVIGMNGNLLIIKYQSGLNRKGYFDALVRNATKQAKENSSQTFSLGY